MNPEVSVLARFIGISVLLLPRVLNLCQDQREMRFEVSQQWDHPNRRKAKSLSLKVITVDWGIKWGLEGLSSDQKRKERPSA